MQASSSSKPKLGPSSEQEVERELAEAYWRLGQAFAAEATHPDQDHFKAALVM